MATYRCPVDSGETGTAKPRKINDTAQHVRLEHLANLILIRRPDQQGIMRRNIYLFHIRNRSKPIEARAMVRATTSRDRRSLFAKIVKAESVESVSHIQILRISKIFTITKEKFFSFIGRNERFGSYLKFWREEQPK
jgi:hypothetical protein